MGKWYQKIGAMRPEKLALAFEVFAPESGLSGSGRERVAPGEMIGTVQCVLSSASGAEAEAFHQLRVEVSHVLTARGVPVAYPGCVMQLPRGRRFRVKDVRDKSGLNLFSSYYCEELI